MSPRQNAIQEIAQHILVASQGIDHPYRIAINGRTVAGKTSFADDARDWQAITSLMLDPLGPDGVRMYRIQIFDLRADVPLHELPLEAPSDAVVILDGTFLQQEELAGGFDFIIFVDVTTQEYLARGVSRDSALLGGPDQAGIVFEERYPGAFEIYEKRTDIRSTAKISLWRIPTSRIPN
ncbi:hypothetical protein [uncultured Phyllobacterium sp.]|uniref:hypothetical protein n=1 Tax=uncultured Phyllobacterium sp. TaxID=253813 RepID=UPI00258EC96D|nr:hypothetical protein [uncultured Phyllobacterium sp.]